MDYYDILYNLQARVIVGWLKILQTYLRYEEIIHFCLVL